MRFATAVGAGSPAPEYTELEGHVARLRLVVEAKEAMGKFGPKSDARCDLQVLRTSRAAY